MSSLTPRKREPPRSSPGWRELPIVPARLRDIDKPGLSKAARKWIEDHCPKSMQIVGAPVITERSSMGTRHVPGRSPWGGYDISHTAVEPTHKVGTRKRRRTPDVSLEPTRATVHMGERLVIDAARC